MNEQPFLKFECNLSTFTQKFKDQIHANKEAIASLLALSSKNYAHFVKPLELLDEKLNQVFTPLSHLNAVSNNDESQAVYSECLMLLTEYSTDLGQNREIYEATKQIKALEYNLLNVEQQRTLDLSILNFELSGAHLDNEKKTRLKEIQMRLSELSNTYSQNVLNAMNAYEMVIDNEADVAGIPESDLSQARFENEGETFYRFTLQLPSFISYMTYGPNRQKREELYKAFVTKAPENGSIIDETLRLRKEMAQLLGFNTFAELSLADKMAPSTQKVMEFLYELQKNSSSQAKRELQEVQHMADVKLQSYDFGFYSEQLKKQSLELDEEEYRPYFEKNSVVEGLFDFLHELFDLKFIKTDEALSHPTAHSYDVYIGEKLQARLYLDLEARKHKRSGAWMADWQSHCLDYSGKEQLASAFVVANFPPQSDTHPSLLRHDDVVTLFHEMGHALHHILSQVNECGVSGVHGVEWDAVEFPSQYLENFAYEKNVLQRFAKHYQNAQVIDDAMCEKLKNSKNFLSALSMLRQLEFALFDFELHNAEYSGEAVQALLDRIRQQCALITPPSYNRFQNSFTHIFAGGYAAGYYSYKWAEVLSADAFLQTYEGEHFNTSFAHEYLKKVLNKGGSQSMQLLFKKLLGREPDVHALLKVSGIQC